MKAYGVKKRDAGCCPGHDKYPRDRYKITRTGGRKRNDKHRKSSARWDAKRTIAKGAY